jgi:Haem-dependent oxidative N-demethylase, alpha subunit-like
VTDPAWVTELGLGRPASWPSMGVRADDRPWPDRSATGRLALRRRLAAEHPEAIAALPGSDAAVVEVTDLVDADDLAGAATTQDDDVCVLAAQPAWPLIAGAVLFPSHWRLADKLGLPVAEVHGRVPGYPAAQVDRFLDRLRPGQVAWRRNLLLHRDGELHTPDPSTEEVPVAAWWLRSERQTFRVLPASGAVLFTIHTDTVPLAELDPGTREQLADRLASMPPAWAPYAAVGFRLAELVSWLRGVEPSR